MLCIRRCLSVRLNSLTTANDHLNTHGDDRLLFAFRYYLYLDANSICLSYTWSNNITDVLLPLMSYDDIHGCVRHGARIVNMHNATATSVHRISHCAMHVNKSSVLMGYVCVPYEVTASRKIVQFKWRKCDAFKRQCQFCAFDPKILLHLIRLNKTGETFQNVVAERITNLHILYKCNTVIH